MPHGKLQWITVLKSKTFSPLTKALSSILWSSFSVKIPSGSAKTATIAASTLISSAAAVIYKLTVTSLLSSFFKSYLLLASLFNAKID